MLERKGRPSPVEHTKHASRHLRGSLRESLEDGDPGLSELDQRVAKFHGIYQQEDRDARAIARLTGAARQPTFMVRTRIPAGQMTAEQYLAVDQLAEDFVYNRSLRITTRQNLQFHGLLKGDLKEAIQRVNQVLISTLCGCGDVERNIVAPPAPLVHGGHRELHALAAELTEAMAPATNAYHEIWLDGECIDSSRETEPLYGPAYLPRKFKTGLGLPEDNSADVHGQDVGLIGIVESGELRGANVVVGGGSGLTHRKSETFARLATPLGFVDRVHLVGAVQTIASIYRDFGDRTDRRHARLKYIVEEWGIDVFRREFARRAAFPLQAWVEMGRLRHRDWLGPHEQGDGRWLYGIWLENGRIIDDARHRWKTALRTLVETLRPAVVLTPQQNLLLADLSEDEIPQVEKVLRAFALPVPDGLSFVRRHSLACPAMPTCGLALAESERVSAEVTLAFERALESLGLDDTPVTLRMTGCPNGCVRPYNADLGFVGRKPGHYDVFVGGTLEGTRLGELHAESVPQDELVARLQPLLQDWAARRRSEEGLGDFYDRCWREGGRRDLLTGEKARSGSSITPGPDNTA
ncbi:MAG: NADPH-dependent assimilatory sulfite reductase hemoprotein subunit [Myxococcales bacterium]|nr:NADPH-dependent assimilatory sulfite reductase hemoprotein subunit [Myxococcales bacterium]